jgi:hypothetical protein
VQVVHVFEEIDQEAMAGHLENWFGYPEAGFGWDKNDRAIVCFCGGRLFPLARDGGVVSVAGVWHREHWYDVPIQDDQAQ